ncbi:hypothetical protein PFISCL1PPCAC_11459, partial [Pristionchus fissidentatus]
MIFLLLFLVARASSAVVFNVTEDAEKNHLIGYISGPSTSTEVTYLIVYPDNATEKAIVVDDRTGAMRVAGELDYETRTRFDILAVPLNGGEGVQITLNILDVNDNSPAFTPDFIQLDISEVARKGSLFHLPAATDADSPPLDVQSYSILRGNVNNVFRLQTSKVEGELMTKLQLNGQLDREYRESYELIIEAKDGGEPARSAQLTVRVLVKDVNDNAPKFAQTNYSVSINANVSVHTPVLNLTATDIDEGANARISYRLANIRSDRDSAFSLHPNGSLFPAAPLAAGAYDLVVVAADGGSPPLEGTAFVSLTVKAPDQPITHFDIVWLTDHAEATLEENITIGSIVARLSVTPPDPRIHLEMSGCVSLCIRETDTLHVYLLSVCAPFDRETTSEYQLIFSLKREQTTVLDHPIMLQIRDVNDNAPSWSASSMTIRLNRSRDDTVDLSATDADAGDNARISYSIEGSNAVIIDPESGKVRLADKGCTPTPFISFSVVARDHGRPSLSSMLQVRAEIAAATSSVRCALPLYETTVREDLQHGSCILEVSTWSEDGWCGSSPSKVNFSLKGDGDGLFTVDQKTGQICIKKALDYEKAHLHELSVDLVEEDVFQSASDSCRVSVRVDDVNDNAPLFSPLLYKMNMRESEAHPTMPLLRVSATDMDEGVFGEVHYKLVSTSEGLFHLNSTTGELSARQRLTVGLYRMEVVAVDGGEKESIETAMVEIRVLPHGANLPRFVSTSPLTLETSEDILPGIEIGRVEAIGNTHIHYSFYSGDPSHFFAIDGDTGKITVVKYLDADANDHVLLNVQASLNGGESAFTQVLIKIEDHNDNAPVFSADSVTVRVREDHPIDKPFYVVTGRDKDRGKNGRLSYSLLSSVPDGPFAVNPITGHLRLTAPIDYETTKMYRLTVRATDGGIPSKSASLTLVVQIIDVNDNAPIFEKAVYAATVVENSPVMTKVLRVKANDVDSGLGGRVEYSLSGADSSLFSIDSRTGDVYTRKELDREEREEYVMNVTAMDKGVSSHSTSSSLRISILDVNDNSPSCSALLPITVSADADSRKAIGSIVALDPDAGANGTLTYRTQQHNVLFLVRANGEVLVRRSLQREEGQRVSLPVLVADGGLPPKSTLCHISIFISSGEPSIAIEGELNREVILPDECPSLPCPVIQINASGVTRWRLQSSDLSSSLSISSSGLISQSSPVSTHSVRVLHVIMEDSNGRQKTLNLRVHPPKLKKSNGRVIRVPTSTPIGSLVASFGDERKEMDGSAVYYEFMNKTDLFELDRSSGSLYVIAPLSPHIGSVQSLVVKKNNLANQTVIVEAIWIEIEGDLPVRPSFNEQIVRKSILETSPTGMVVHQLHANSTERGALVLYRIVEEDGIFECDPSSGEIRLAHKVDKYAGKDIVLTAVADIDGIEAASVIVFTVQDVNNNAPVFVSAPLIRLREETSKTLPFHHAVAIDSDVGVNARVTYSIVGESNHFEIDGETGALSLLSRLSSDAWVTVRATDGGLVPLSTDQSIHVVVEKAKWRFFDKPSQNLRVLSNQPRHTLLSFPSQKDVKLTLLPRTSLFAVNEGELKARGQLTEQRYTLTAFAESSTGETDWMPLVVDVGEVERVLPKIASMSCQSVTIPENQKIDGFKQVIAASRGVNGTFNIKGGNEAGQFSIDTQSGALSCKELDRERKREHLLVVSLKDELNSDSCTIRVKVRDDNDNPPLLLSKHREILLRDGQEGSVVMTLKQVEKDGRVILARNLPYSSREWPVKIRLFDHGASQSLESLWELTVKDERKKKDGDPSKPSFLRQSYSGFVEEGRPAGVQVLTVTTTADRDAPMTYSIVQGNVDLAFDIDAHGVITTGQELDREIRSQYDLTVIATSSSFPSTLSTMVTVTVLNMNDNPPTVQTPPRRKISEATPVGTFISTITATDIDEDSILTYSIDPPSDYFAIDRFTGVIHSTAPLDYEKEKAVELEIIVSDGLHQVRASLHISILDENDNSPVFSSPFYDIVVPQTLGHQSIVGHITATDADSDEKTRIEYSIISADPLPFKLDAETGQLTSNDPSALRSSFLFSVSATDNGSPPRNSVASVRVRPASGISFSPYFKQKNYRFTIVENSLAWTLLGNISIAVSPMHYRIVDLAASSSFFISDSGLLFTRIPLDRETLATHRFRIDAGDSWNDLSANSSTTVTVDVLDENDNSPRFEPINPIVITEEMQRGDVIQRLTAVDSDAAENGSISYRIVAGNDYSVFTLDESTGALSFNEWSDAQLLSSMSPYSWKMVIVAEDGGRPAKSTLITVHVQVGASSWRGAAPFFPLSAYHVFVPENAHVGMVVLKSRPVSRVGVRLDGVTYSLHDNDGAVFNINAQNGVISLAGPLDYETKEQYTFTISVTDAHSRSAVSSIIIHVLPIDEFAPVFTKSAYTFMIPQDSSVGSSVGFVQASDGDGGRDGTVNYRLSNVGGNRVQGQIVDIDGATGELTLRRRLQKGANRTLEQITIIASSGPLQQSSTIVFLEMGDLPSRPSHHNSMIRTSTMIIGFTFLALLILLFLLIVCVCLRVYSIKRDTASNHRIDIQRESPTFEPPPQPPILRSIDPNRHSIRDLLSSRSQPDSGIDPDTCSVNSSITEYLTSIGVAPLPSTLLSSRPFDHRHRREDESEEDRAVNELIYAPVSDILTPGPLNLSRHPHYLDAATLPCSSSFTSFKRNSPPTFQPLATLLQQMENTKEEKKRDYVQIS